MTSKHYASSAASNALDKIYSGQAQYAIFSARHERNESTDALSVDAKTDWSELDSTFNEHVHFTHDLEKIDLSKLLVFSGQFKTLETEQLILALDAIAHTHEKAGSNPDTADSGLLFEIGVKPLSATDPTGATSAVISRSEIMRRVFHILYSTELHEVQLHNSYVMITANAPLFLHKAQILRNCAFIVGTRALQRILDPAYYSAFSGHVEDAVSGVLSKMKSMGSTFIVGMGSENIGLGAYKSALEAGRALVVERRPPLPAQAQQMFEYILPDQELEGGEDSTDEEDD